jgi:twinkle protein
MAGFDSFVVTDDQVDFTKYAVQPDDLRRFVKPYDVYQEICDLSFGKMANTGLTLPWERFKDHVRFQRGKWTIWGGYTHHGKTHVLKQVMAWALKCNEPVAICSMEERPGETMFDICCMATQMRNPDAEAIDVFCNWAKDKIWVYDQKRLMTPERVIGVANYAAAELGAAHFVTDSLMRLDLDLEDQEATKVFGNMIGLHAEHYNYHHHLVAHARKGDETKPGSIYDIKGCAELIGQCDKSILVWRNKVPRTERIPEKHIKDDAVLVVDKQRGRPNWLGRIGLDYHHASTQLVPAEAVPRPVQYIPGFGAPLQTAELF